MMRSEDGKAYRFEGFLLDTVRGTLFGRDHVAIPLRPKTFSLLAYLLERPGRLMGREELMDTLWPGLVVTDDSLTQCISDLRKAFGGSASAVLRTVPRRGYILAAEVRTEQLAHVVPSELSTPMLGPASSATRDTIHVHPVDNHDATASEFHLAETLTAELTATLAPFEHLRVLKAAEGFTAEGYHLRLAVRSAGAKWRGTVRLEDEAGATVWGDRLEWLREEGPEPSEEMLGNLAAEVDRQVNRESLRRAVAKPVAERTARDYYLLGKEHHLRTTEADTLIARDMFDKAIAAAPSYAAAYAWQAYVVQRAVTYGWGKPDGQAGHELALQLARRGVELAPDSPLCLGRLAFMLALNKRWEEAVNVARAALRTRRPIYVATRADCADVLATCGHAEEAVGILRHGLAKEPYAQPGFRAMLGRVLLLADRVDEALTELQWCAARLPDYAPCYLYLLVAYTEVGEMEKARLALRELVRLQGDVQPRHERFRYDKDFKRFRSAIEAAKAYDLGQPLMRSA
ncbi:transcriptional regulator [Roseomonas sp. KE2513]|uniref:winged helix-turn-helix domain-containing protein n=1 Tax=Roseomonas sp. KE2513 TaxID=2479202 RepID=UPI0018DF19D5|nr:transcriptional regulator [Roseomonas sp. KE2513]